MPSGSAKLLIQMGDWCASDVGPNAVKITGLARTVTPQPKKIPDALTGFAGHSIASPPAPRLNRSPWGRCIQTSCLLTGAC